MFAGTSPQGDHASGLTVSTACSFCAFRTQLLRNDKSRYCEREWEKSRGSDSPPATYSGERSDSPSSSAATVVSTPTGKALAASGAQ